MDTLDKSDIDELLRSTGFGFLGLADGAHAYVIPMSFGYDGEDLYFQMNSTGKKIEYISETAIASFAVINLDPKTGISKSVIIEGELSEVPGDGRMAAFEALAANAEFGSDLEVWGVSVMEADLTLFELQPTAIAGRIFGEKMAE